MDSYSKTERTSKRVKSNAEKPKLVRLVLTKDKIVNVVGKATGKKYTFNRAGAVLYVDERDAEVMLQKVSGRPCCRPNPSRYFELVED